MSYAGARDRAAVPDPHFVLTSDAHAYIGAHMPKDPPIVDIAAISAPAPRRTIVHHARRVAYVGVSCLLAVGGAVFCAACMMMGAWLAFHR